MSYESEPQGIGEALLDSYLFDVEKKNIQIATTIVLLIVFIMALLTLKILNESDI
jgi:hypothetical protein